MKKFISLLLLVGMAQSTLMAQSEFSNPSISIGLVASDFDTSYKFYTEIIGMKEVGGFSVPEVLSEKIGLAGGVAFDVKVLKLMEDDNATEFKLLSFKKPKNPAESNITDRNGMRYVTIFYSNLDGVIQRLKANNIPFLSEEPTHIPDGRRFVLVQDPDGVFVELIGK